MVLEMAPMTCVPMAKSGRPSACTQKFIANENIAAGTPMRMIRMYSRAMGSSFSSAPLKRSRESVSSMPKAIRTTLRMRMDETTFPSTSSARSGFRSPSAREIRGKAPIPNKKHREMRISMKGKQTLMAASPSGPTTRPTNMRSTMLYREPASIPAIDGSAKATISFSTGSRPIRSGWSISLTPSKAQKRYFKNPSAYNITIKNPHWPVSSRENGAKLLVSSRKRRCRP